MIGCQQPSEKSLNDDMTLEKWLFTIGPDIKKEYKDIAPIAAWDTVNVPHNWNTQNNYSDYVGKACYKTTFTTPDISSKRLQLYFEAVYHDSKVWLDGELLGTSNSGYLPFSFDITDRVQSGRVHEITLLVDNTFKRGAMYNWGGIRRPVSLRVLEPVRIKKTFITSEVDLEAQSATVKVKVAVRNDNETDEKFTSNGNIYFENNPFGPSIKIDTTIPAQSTLFLHYAIEVKEDDLKLWHFDEPNLYILKMESEDGEMYTQAFGIRKTELKDNQFFLNGEAVRLCGYNWVPDHRFYGNTLPFEQVKQDIDLMKAAGANMARLTHLPLHQDAMDYLDQIGMLTVAEIPLWAADRMIDSGNTVPFEWMKKLVDENYNHPGVIAWSVGNEMGRHPNVVNYAKTMHQFIKDSLDNSRYVMDVSFTAAESKDDASQFSDIVMLNAYGYKAVEEYHSKAHDNFPDKPIFYSEFGTFLMNEDPNKGQQDVDRLVSLLQGHKYLFGASLWTFNDYRSEWKSSDPTWETTPSQSRGWGIVDIYRNKKRAYKSFQKAFAPIAGLHLIDNNTVEIEARKKYSIPSYTMRNYKLIRASLSAKNQQGLDSVLLPVIKPGQESILAQFKNEITGQKSITYKLKSPLGYVLWDTTVYSNAPVAPKIDQIIPYKRGGKIIIAESENGTAEEYFAKVCFDGECWYSDTTIHNYIYVNDLNVDSNYQVEIYALNSFGMSKPSKAKHFSPLPLMGGAPQIFATSVTNDGLYVGYNSSKYDYIYEFQFSGDKNIFGEEIDFQIRNKGCAFIPKLSNQPMDWFRMRIVDQYYIASAWSEPIPIDWRQEK